jgi:hypothetical protein
VFDATSTSMIRKITFKSACTRDEPDIAKYSPLSSEPPRLDGLTIAHRR